MLYIDKSDLNNIFDDNIKYTVYRDNFNNLYGFIMTDGTVELFKPCRSNKHDMYINSRTMNRIENIYFTGNDKRIKSLYDFILHEHDSYNKYNYYCIQYNDDDLFRWV